MRQGLFALLLSFVSGLAAAEPERVPSMLARLKSWYSETMVDASPQLGGWISE